MFVRECGTCHWLLCCWSASRPLSLILMIVACRMPSGFCHMLLLCHAKDEMAYVRQCVAAGQSGVSVCVGVDGWVAG